MDVACAALTALAALHGFSQYSIKTYLNVWAKSLQGGALPKPVNHFDDLTDRDCLLVPSKITDSISHG